MITSEVDYQQALKRVADIEDPECAEARSLTRAIEIYEQKLFKLEKEFEQ